MSTAETLNRVEADMVYVRPDVEKLVLSFDTPGVDLPLEMHRLPVVNARLDFNRPELDVHGFTLIPHHSDVVANRRDELIEANAFPHDIMPSINIDYAAELLPTMQALSGAREVFAQYNTAQVRFSKNSKKKSWMGTSAFVHLDFTPEQIEKLITETLEMTGRQVEPYSRHVLMQSWRVITPPPQDQPLTLCDGRTVSLDQMIPMEFHGPAGSKHELIKSRVCAWHPDHRWYYYPEMTLDEVLVFKGFDSACPDAMNAMHTTFNDETVQTAIPRGSVECRFIALYD